MDHEVYSICELLPSSYYDEKTVKSEPWDCVTIAFRCAMLWKIGLMANIWPLEPWCPVSTVFLLTCWLVQASPLCCVSKLVNFGQPARSFWGAFYVYPQEQALFKIWCYLQRPARIFSVACSVETGLWSVLPTRFPVVFTHSLSSNTWEMWFI